MISVDQENSSHLQKEQNLIFASQSFHKHKSAGSSSVWQSCEKRDLNKTFLILGPKKKDEMKENKTTNLKSHKSLKTKIPNKFRKNCQDVSNAYKLTKDPFKTSKQSKQSCSKCKRIVSKNKSNYDQHKGSHQNKNITELSNYKNGCLENAGKASNKVDPAKHEQWNQKDHFFSTEKSNSQSIYESALEKNSLKNSIESQSQKQMMQNSLIKKGFSPPFFLALSPIIGRTSRIGVHSDIESAYDINQTISSHQQIDCSTEKCFSRLGNSNTSYVTPALLSPLYYIENCQTNSTHLLPLVIPSNDNYLFQSHLSLQKPIADNFSKLNHSDNFAHEKKLWSEQRENEKNSRKKFSYLFQSKEKNKLIHDANKNLMYRSAELRKSNHFTQNNQKIETELNVELNNDLSGQPNSSFSHSRQQDLSSPQKWEKSNYFQKCRTNFCDAKNVTFSDQAREYSNLSFPSCQERKTKKVHLNLREDFVSKNSSSVFNNSLNQKEFKKSNDCGKRIEAINKKALNTQR